MTDEIPQERPQEAQEGPQDAQEAPQEGQAQEGPRKAPARQSPANRDWLGRRPKKVVLERLTYDAENERYVMFIEKMDADDLPLDALPISGKTNRYFMSEVEPEPRQQGPIQDEHGHDLSPMQASTYDLYMKNNAINEALASRWKAPLDIDWKQIAVIGIVAVVALYMLIGGVL